MSTRNETETAGDAGGANPTDPQRAADEAPAVEIELPGPEATPPAGATAGEAAALPEADVDAEREALEARVAELERKVADERERHLRAAADLENFRKRAARERDDVQKFGIERLLKDLLPVMDNLDRALAAAPEDDPVAGGVKLVRRVFEESLAKHGVEVFSAAGKAFDPRLHEALAQVDAPDAEPGTVVAEHARGFLLNGRLLRPAMVAVAAPRREAPPEPAGEAGE